MADFCKGANFAPLPASAANDTIGEFDRIRASKGNERAANIRSEMQNLMTNYVGVFRNGPDMQKAVDGIRELKKRFKNLKVDDTGKIFNTDVLESFELGCLLDLAEVTAAAALHRTETRGGHAREDFENRDDVNWLNHSMVYRADGKSDVTVTDCNIRFEKKPVVITKYQPKERKY
jgi:succinate dehydrogenase / fumarate reductase flavoprotein subunit